MGVVLLEALLTQLLGQRDEDGLSEVLRSQLANKCQPCGGEQHLLANGCRVWHKGDGEELGSGVEPTENDVEGDIGLDVRLQAGEVVFKGGGGRRQRGKGDERLFVDGREKAKGVVGSL